MVASPFAVAASKPRPSPPPSLLVAATTLAGILAAPFLDALEAVESRRLVADEAFSVTALPAAVACVEDSEARVLLHREELPDRRESFADAPPLVCPTASVGTIVAEEAAATVDGAVLAGPCAGLDLERVARFELDGDARGGASGRGLPAAAASLEPRELLLLPT